MQKFSFCGNDRLRGWKQFGLLTTPAQPSEFMCKKTLENYIEAANFAEVLKARWGMEVTIEQIV